MYMSSFYLLFLFGNFIPFCIGLPYLSSSFFTNDLRIIGGEAAPEGFAPHMVALIVGEIRKHVFCGGSIISSLHVLTAAHCVDPFSDHGVLDHTLHGLVGSNQWNSGGVKVYFKSYQNHPDWDARNLKYDASILTLKEELELNAKVAIIRLGFDWIGEAESTYVTGWGNTGPRFEDNIVHLAPTPDDLQLLYVNTISSEACINGINQMGEAWQMPFVPPVHPHVEICTFHSRGHGMCNGDSGSALVHEKTGKQIGIVSWGFPCAVGAPDVYTRIRSLENFLIPYVNEI